MPLVYLDTNVVDVYLKGSSGGLGAFKSIKKNFNMQFVMSMDLLAELAANPDVEKAKESLRIVREFCSYHLFVFEPRILLVNEVNCFFEGKDSELYLSKEKAENIFENRIWRNLVDGRLEEVNSWLKELKKQKYVEERKECSKTRKELGELGISSEAGFDEVYGIALTTGYARRYVEGLVFKFLGKDISTSKIDLLMSSLKKLPILHSFLLYDLVYFMYFYLKNKPLDKHGNSLDARHVVSAATSDYFLSNDEDLVEMTGYAKGYWNFLPMSPGQYREKYCV